MVNEPEVWEFNPREDWKTSDLAAQIELFSHPTIKKVVGHPKRADFIFMSDEPGHYALYRFDPKTNESRNIMVDNEPFTDHVFYTNFMLHASNPWVIYTEDKIGDQNHSLILLDYEKNTAKRIVTKIGAVTKLFFYRDMYIIAVVQKKDCNAILLIDYQGGINEIFRADEQILSAGIADRKGYVIASIGRGSTKLAVIDIETQDIVHWISETESSWDTRPIVNDEMGYLAYITNPKGNIDELVVCKIDTWEEIMRIDVPGFVGYFILDLDYMQWINNSEIMVVVSKDALSSPRILNIEKQQWTAPLSEFTVGGSLASTKNYICWPSSSFSHSGFIEAYRHGTIETIIPPAFEHSDLNAESHWFTSYDGLKIQGWLVRNPSNEKAPVIIQCHGGPTYVTLNEWDPFTAILVNAGYHVFQPNFRGSTTFGPDFQALNAGDMGGGDVQDVLYAAKYVAEIFDMKTKPILTGASYGGYLTLQCSVKHPEVWSGGVARVPLADLVGEWEHANAHYKHFLIHFLGGTYDEKPNLYRERSPVTHLEFVQNPLLIFAGKNDPNAYFEPIQNFYERAREMNKPVSLIAWEGGHGTKSGEENMEKLVYMIDFIRAINSII